MAGNSDKEISRHLVGDKSCNIHHEEGCNIHLNDLSPCQSQRHIQQSTDSDYDSSVSANPKDMAVSSMTSAVPKRPLKNYTELEKPVSQLDMQYRFDSPYYKRAKNEYIHDATQSVDDCYADRNVQVNNSPQDPKSI